MLVNALDCLGHLAPSAVLGWLGVASATAGGYYRLRQYRAATREREELANQRIAHARRTGEFQVLEARQARRMLLTDLPRRRDVADAFSHRRVDP